MADQGRSDFYVAFTMNLCALGLKQLLTEVCYLNHTALILSVHALRSYLKLIVNMSFIAYQIKKIVAQRIMVKTTSRSDRPWSAIFCVIVYLCKISSCCCACDMKCEHDTNYRHLEIEILGSHFPLPLFLLLSLFTGYYCSNY